MNLIESLNWRYATKKMNGKKISDADLNTILETIQLSASSYGMQPYQVLVVENEEIKKQLQPLAYGQAQIVDCSHVLIFTALHSISESHIDEYLQAYSSSTGMPMEKLIAFGMKDRMMQSIVALPQNEQYHWAAKQAYIALGSGIIAAATLHVDATPMEGFMPDKVDELLSLKDKNLRSVAFLALGYRDEAQDFMANAPKFRWPKEKLFTAI
jgi:nitroreductase / dihydropteridine reductase